MTTRDYDENKKDIYEQVYAVCTTLEKISKNINDLRKSIDIHYDNAWKFMRETEINEEKYTEEEYMAAVDAYDEWDELYSVITEWHEIVDTALYHLNEIG